MNEVQRDRLIDKVQGLHDAVGVIEQARVALMPLTHIATLSVNVMREVEATESYSQCLIDADERNRSAVTVMMALNECKKARQYNQRLLFGGEHEKQFSTFVGGATGDSGDEEESPR